MWYREAPSTRSTLASLAAIRCSETSVGNNTGPGGELIVEAGGSAVGATVGNGGVAVVSSGDSASAMTVSAGGVLSVYAGANLAATAILDGASEVLVSGSLGTGGIQTNLVLEAGSSALNTIVGSGGALIALASGTWVGNTTVLDGGKLLVSSGATASAAVIASGGSAAVADGDVANSITLSSGATLIVSSGGAAGLLPLSSGGSATLQGNIVDNSVVALALSGGTAVIDSATLYGQGLFEVTGSGTYVVGDGTSFHGSTIVSASGAGAPADQVTMIVPGGAVISNVFDYGEVVSVSGGGATLNTSVLPDVQSGR